MSIASSDTIPALTATLMLKAISAIVIKAGRSASNDAAKSYRLRQRHQNEVVIEKDQSSKHSPGRRCYPPPLLPDC